ncbi:uncharacterized protein LOC144607074 isoform X2 [Rhinoraja longicauda]
MELSEDYFLVKSDNAQDSLSKQINLDKSSEDGIKLELNGEPIIESDKILCMWCGYYALNKQCFEDHIREQHSHFELRKEISASSNGLQCFGTRNSCLNSQVHSSNNESLKRKAIVKKIKPVRHSVRKNISSITGKSDGYKSSKNMPEESITQLTFGQRNPNKMLKYEKQTLRYIKRLCLFHCILCRFHTLFHNCILRHVRNVHFNQSGSRKLKSGVRFSEGSRTPKLCNKQRMSKKLSLNNCILSSGGNDFTVDTPDTSIKSENKNLVSSNAEPFFYSSKLGNNESISYLSKEDIDPNCETSLLHQINDQLQFSVPCFAYHSDINADPEMSRDFIGAPLYLSTTMTPNKKTNENGLYSVNPASSKCLALEDIVKNLKKRRILPIKCTPVVSLLNDRSTRRKRTIPYCRTTEEQHAKWMLEAYSFLNQQKIERAAEFTIYGDNCLSDTVAEIEVVLSDTDDNVKRTNLNACKNYDLCEKFTKSADEIKMLYSTSSNKRKLGNAYTRMYKCNICPFSSANINDVFLHSQEQHSEEEMSCKKIHNYSHKFNMLTKRNLRLSMHDVFLIDSESSDPTLPCLDASSKICFCKHCSYSGDWLSLFEHYQSSYLSKKEPKSQNVNYLQVRGQLASLSTSNSEPQLVFECQVCNFTCTSRRVICRHHCIKRSIACAQVEDSEIVFKCALCMFTHIIREGLVNHYLVLHNIEPPYRYYGKGHDELGSLTNSNEELKASMEKQICILCSFKAITQKKLLFHYKLRHFKFYSQNKCTIECKKTNINITNFHPFDEIKTLRENGNENVNAVTDREMYTESKIDAEVPLNCSNAGKLELINCKGSDYFVKAIPIRNKLGNENCIPKRKTDNSFSVTANSMNMTRFHLGKLTLSRRESEHLGYNVVMPEEQNVDSRDLFCETLDPLNKVKYKETDKTCIPDAEDQCLQGNLVSENKISSCYHSVKKHYSKFAVNQSIAMEGYRCRYCTRLFKALAGLRNHEKTHYLSKNCHRSADKSSKKNKYNVINDILTASSEGRNYRCPRCSYSTPLIEHLRSHSLRVHGRFLMPKLRSMTLDSLKTGGYVSQPLNENVFLETPQSDCQDCIISSGSATEVMPKTVEMKRYACEFCDFNTCLFQNVKNHYRTMHHKNLYFECKRCYFFSGEKNALSRHAEVCKLTADDRKKSARKMDVNIFEGSLGEMGNEIESEVGLKEEFALASIEKKSGKLHCPMCLYYTKHKNRLVNHILEHKNGQAPYVEDCHPKLLQFFTEKIFCCDWCTFVTLSEENLLHHMDTHSPVKPYKCRLCFFEAGLQTELESHLHKQHKVKCNFDLVGEVNLSEAELVAEIEEFQRKRLQSSHHEKRIQSCIRHHHSTKSTQFPCEYCGRRFLDPLEWMRHVQRHSIGR